MRAASFLDVRDQPPPRCQLQFLVSHHVEWLIGMPLGCSTISPKGFWRLERPGQAQGGLAASLSGGCLWPRGSPEFLRRAPEFPPRTFLRTFLRTFVSTNGGGGLFLAREAKCGAKRLEKFNCWASQRQLLVNNSNLNSGPGPAWFLLAPSCSFVLAVAGFCRREERQGKQVNQSTPSRHQSRSNSGAERREKMDVHLGPATHDVVAAKHDVVAAKHDVRAAKHDVCQSRQVECNSYSS